MATVIGLIHAGQLNLDALKELTDIVVDPYTSGLHDEDDDVSMATVRHGFLGTLVVRSALSVIPLHRLADPPTAELANPFPGLGQAHPLPRRPRPHPTACDVSR
jgi:hypothetical protein